MRMHFRAIMRRLVFGCYWNFQWKWDWLPMVYSYLDSFIGCLHFGGWVSLCFCVVPPRNKHTEIHGNTYRKPQLIVVCQRGFQVEQAVLRFWLPVNTTSKNVDVFRTESCLTNHSWDVEPKMVGETAAASPAILTILARLTL